MPQLTRWLAAAHECPIYRASLRAILEHIAEEDPVTAHRFVGEIVDNIEGTPSAQPRAGRPSRVTRTREWVAHSNYVVAYRVTKADDVAVLDVVHAARLWPTQF